MTPRFLSLVVSFLGATPEVFYLIHLQLEPCCRIPSGLVLE